MLKQLTSFLSGQLGTGICMVGAGIFMLFQCHQITTLKEERQHLQQELQVKDKFIQSLQDTIKLNEQIISERADYEELLQRLNAANRRNLEKILQADKQASDWSTTVIPASIMQLHKDRASDGITRNTSKPDATNSVSRAGK